jgi:hypothetical protein
MNTHIDVRVRERFQQLPFLIGFSLDRELCVCDVEVDTEVIGGIIEEGAADELLERTFARSLH